MEPGAGAGTKGCRFNRVNAMDEIKLQRLRHDHPSVVVRHLTESESKRILTDVRNRIGLAADSGNGLRVVRDVRAQSAMVHNMNAEASDFDLFKVFQAARLIPQERIYINWYGFDDLDEVDVRHLAAYFDDFWYPKADDIDLFDRTLSWILSVDSEGTFWVFRV